MKITNPFRKALEAIVAAVLILLPCENAFAATYTVTSGDTLYKIGQIFNTSASFLQSSNNLSGTIIYPGQKLTVSCEVYTVKSGDTLYLIAKSKGVSLDALRRANNKYDDMIYVGQSLNIPGSTLTAKGVIPYTQSDVDLLARLINAEAGAEPYSAKVAVGAVIVNRVKNPLFPNSIRGVIYEVDNGYYQFTPVLNGMINKPATAESLQAAYAALSGTDPTRGALYFFDSSVNNQWLQSKTVAIKIDKMTFSYYN